MSLSLHLYLSTLTICLVVVLYHRKSLTGHFRWLFWLICITWVVEGIGYYSLRTQNQIAGWVFHLFTPIEYSLIALYFYTILSVDWLRKAIYVSIPIVWVYAMLNLLFWQDIKTLSTNTFLVMAFLFSVWAAFYLYQLLTVELPTHRFWKNPDFWVVTGILSFYAGAFFVMGFINIISKNNPTLAKQLYSINHVLNILLYSLYSVGFICRANSKDTSLS